MGPDLFRKMVAADQVNDGLPHIRIGRFGGSEASRSDVESFFGWARHATLRHSLGMSEIKHVSSYLITRESKLPDDVVPLGYDTPGVETLVLDEEGNPVEPGEIGELVVKSPFVCPGYWNRPELNAEKVRGDRNGQPERYLYTGDLAQKDANGCLFHRGRKDFQIKVRGYRVEPGELEATLMQAPGVADAAVAMKQIDGGEARLIAFIVPDKSFDSVTAIRNHVAQKLPSYMLPHKFVPVSAIPHTQSDKIDRKGLETMIDQVAEGAPPTSTTARNPETQTEEILTRVWNDALERKEIGVDEDFFDIGGDSLVAAVIVDQIFRVFGKRVQINILFQAPTIAELAQHVDSLTSSSTPIVPIRPSGSKPPIFCFHSLGGSVLGYYGLARYLPDEYPVWGIQPKGTDGAEAPIDNIPDMARYYCDEITRVHSDGPFILTGISLGGEIAFEVGRELLARGRSVQRLVLIDSATPLPRSASIPFRLWDGAKLVRQKLIYSVAMTRGKQLPPEQARGRIYQNNIRAARAYRNSHPEPVGLPASLIRAVYRGAYHMPDQAIAEWKRLVGGLDSISEVYGAHYGEDYVLDEPNVQAVASEFLKAVTNGAA
jgi:thioesterase domain-containing protein/acyl carrier protein